MFGLDYSAAHPQTTCMVTKGVDFVCRYLEPADDWKTVTGKEIEELTAAGISIVACYEDHKEDILGGYAVGVSNALGVLANAAIGLPRNRPIYFAVDFDATASQLSGVVSSYFRGLASVLPLDRIGIYGGYKTIKYAADNGLAKWFWQTYAWSGGLWDKRAHIQQYDNNVGYCGGTVDFNHGMFEDIGQWDKGEKVIVYPYGYGRNLLPLEVMMAELITHGHPEFVRRLRLWLVAQGGRIGIGDAWRAVQPVKDGFAPPGKSFHQDQTFASGFVGCCAVDLVHINPGNVHRSPTWAEVPIQGSPEAKKWGVHCNVDQGADPEPWHMQWADNSTLLDGWQSWVNVGRPDPVANYGVVIPPAPIPMPPKPATEGTEKVLIAKFGADPTANWGGWYSFDGGVTRKPVSSMAHAATLVDLGALDGKTRQKVTSRTWEGVSITTSLVTLESWLAPY